MALDRADLVADLLERLGPPPVAPDVVAVVRALVDDWAREADPMPDPLAVLRFLREDLDAAVAAAGGLEPGVRLAWLQRRVNRANANALAAARSRRDGSSAAPAQEILAEVESLAAEVAALPPSAAGAAGPLRTALGDAMLDARYAIEGSGATSTRLARDAPSADGPAPPDLRPA